MLPSEFNERMKRILGEEYENFSAALNEPPVRGIRVNGIKLSSQDFLKKTSLSLTPLSYAEYGYIPSEDTGLGKSPEHHAGMYYVQDPGAMAALGALKIERGWRVLDACAAPGGKSSQAASLIGDEGLLFSNEFVPKRAKTLVANFERLGIKNALVTSLDTARLGEMFDSYFDLVICDAPCSGEGMFRKCDDAVLDWSTENIRTSARRQREILDACQGTVKAGGYLLYSTCTYAPEEDEECVRNFLLAHPDFTLVPAREELCAVTRRGLPTEGAKTELTRRFYPHLSRGEGQFVALMKKDENIDKKSRILYKDAAKPLSKDEIALTEAFLRENLTERPKGRLIKQGEGIALVPSDMVIPDRSVFMAGVMLGEIKGKNFLPHHQLFSAYGSLFKNRENLTKCDPRTEKYLHGEEIAKSEGTRAGYTAILYEGVPLGGGKCSGEVIKNHYPKGLRNP